MSVPTIALSGQPAPVVSMVTPPLFAAEWCDEAGTVLLQLTEDADLDTPELIRDAAAQAAAFSEHLMALADKREARARRLERQLAALADGQPEPVVAFVEVVRDAVRTARDPWAAFGRVIELMQAERQTAVTA